MLKKISIIGSNTSNISSRKRLNQFFIVSIVLLFSIYVYTGLTHDRDDYEQWQFKRRLLSENNLIVNKSLIHKIPSLNCQTFLGTDHTKYITEYVNDGRFILNFKSHKFFNSCSEIENFLNISNIQQPDIKHSYAVSRVVHEDFYWLMEELSHTYSPKNSYCFAVDSKSSDEFIELMMKLESCIPNIYLSGKLYSYDSLGHYMNFGHWDCTKVLFKSYNKWSYILWLQNYDIILKTNKEISQIIQFLNGSHSVGYKRAHLKRYNFLRTRTAKSINLWKNESLVTKRQANAELSVSQMYNQVFLSRELIQFVIHNMNLENLLNEFEQPYRFATDELLWPTLLSSPDLQLPGQLKGGCKTEDKYITRYNEWSEIFPCEYSRHGTCIFGMEYFKMLADLHQIVANKILPRFDFGVVMCMGELLRNRSQGITESSAQMAMYTGIAKLMAELYICGQLESGSGFKSNRLSCCWSLEIGGGWKVIEGHTSGQSHTDIPSSFEPCFFSQPIDLHLATKTIQGWPKFHFQIWHYDDYNRQELYGYGSIFVPTAPGAHTLSSPIWRPKGSTRDELMQSFVGGGLQVSNLEVLNDPEERPKLSCVSMGEIQLTLYIVTRHFDRFGILA